jgi:hypothetical protein
MQPGDSYEAMDSAETYEARGAEASSQPQSNLYGHSQQELIDMIGLLRGNLDQMAAERQSYEALQQQVQTLAQAVSRQGLSVPTPSGASSHATSAPTPPSPYQDTVRRYEKPRLPDVEVFEKGSHEDYTQWKTRVQAKLFADRQAYPSEEVQVHYIITRTKGWAFTALRTYVTSMMEGSSQPSLARLWEQLDGFFIDPTIREKAMQWIRTTKQGKGEFIPHVQAFNLKFLEAGLGNASNIQKIDYLKNSLNKRLLRYQVGFQPAKDESYEEFVHRMRVTWENLKAIDQLSFRTLPATSSHTAPSNEDTMDWTPTVAAFQPRTKREFWGTQAQVQERRERGDCLRCGHQGHKVAQCQVKIGKRPARTEGKGAVVAVAAPAKMDTDSEESGKEEP